MSSATSDVHRTRLRLYSPLQPVASTVTDSYQPEDPQTPPVPQDEDERDPIHYRPIDHYYRVTQIVTESDPEEIRRNDDDGDSSRDDANDEDEDVEDEEDEEEEEHLAPADSTTVMPADELIFPPEGIEPISIPQALIDAVTTALPPPPLPPLPPSLHIPPPVDRRDDIPETEQSPRKRLHLSTLGSRYEVGESSTARPTRGQGIDYGFVSMIDC
ncbi:hypothetical protein Tco_0895595 [Tanacetum coccineum]|uniref:Uncharacterized protein n=1 Tax=Tanacetum coccineum TaxID=301880 RepID=A0ABQ5CG79_9ASTR